VKSEGTNQNKKSNAFDTIVSKALEIQEQK